MATPSPAALAAMRDANALAPDRGRRLDGIMGDAAHQARDSDHNRGDAFDLTHDPAHGLDADAIAQLAIRDARTAYVIRAGRIWSRRFEAQGWRPYGGPDPHAHHVHVSVRPEAREDASAWPWAPGATGSRPFGCSLPG